jgi:PilZ domain-containing protein
MRQFIRHPIDVPVEIGIGDDDVASAYHTHDISAGGLAFRSGCAVRPGVEVDICIGCVQPPFHAHARVAWCHPHPLSGYELGVTFLDAEDAFRARMVEQLCHIEDYRRSVQRTEGREIGMDEAAAEWIEKYAAQFPEFGASQLH